MIKIIDFHLFSDPVKLVKKEDKNINIHVKNLMTGKTVKLSLSPVATIQHVKTEIEGKEGIPCHQQHLYYLDTKLENGQTLSDYNVKEESSLRLRLSGESLSDYQTLLLPFTILLYSIYRIG